MKKNAQRQNRRATMQDVAKIARVSVMTVSNVVNEKFAFVSADTKKRVEKAIKQLNYYPSATSRRLRSMQEFSIGMIIVDDAPAYLADPFITEIVAGLSNYLSENNYSLSIQGVTPKEFESAAIFSIVGTDALCCILCGNDSDRRTKVNFLSTLSQPVVLLQETLPVKRPNFAIVKQDDHGGGYMIASHVVSKGARKLVFLEPSTMWPAIEERKKGVLKAARETKGVSVDILTCENEGFDETQATIGEYMSERAHPDAILGGNDHLGTAALRYLQNTGIDVPGELMVTGFNGFMDYYRYTNPVLTTVVSPAYEMGQYTGGMVLNKLQTSKFSRQRTLFPVRLKIGGSA